MKWFIIIFCKMDRIIEKELWIVVKIETLLKIENDV